MAYPARNKSAEEIKVAAQDLAGNDKVKLWYSDGAPELHAVCREMGIRHDKSDPRRSETNGVIETRIGLSLKAHTRSSSRAACLTNIGDRLLSASARYTTSTAPTRRRAQYLTSKDMVQSFHANLCPMERRFDIFLPLSANWRSGRSCTHLSATASSSDTVCILAVAGLVNTQSWARMHTRRSPRAPDDVPTSTLSARSTSPAVQATTRRSFQLFL